MVFAVKRCASLLLVLVALATVDRFSVAAQKGTQTSTATRGIPLKQGQLKQAGIKPVPFPASRSAWSLGVNRHALSAYPPTRLGAGLDKAELPAPGKNLNGRGYANAGLRSSSVTSPVTAERSFDRSGLDTRKLRTTGHPDLGSLQ